MFIVNISKNIHVLTYSNDHNTSHDQVVIIYYVIRTVYLQPMLFFLLSQANKNLEEMMIMFAKNGKDKQSRCMCKDQQCMYYFGTYSWYTIINHGILYTPWEWADTQVRTIQYWWPYLRCFNYVHEKQFKLNAKIAFLF